MSQTAVRAAHASGVRARSARKTSERAAATRGTATRAESGRRGAMARRASGASETPTGDGDAQVIVVTSGKGGVGGKRRRVRILG